jgi:hypothetical protein
MSGQTAYLDSASLHGDGRRRRYTETTITGLRVGLVLPPLGSSVTIT